MKIVDLLINAQCHTALKIGTIYLFKKFIYTKYSFSKTLPMKNGFGNAQVTAKGAVGDCLCLKI